MAAEVLLLTVPERVIVTVTGRFEPVVMSRKGPEAPGGLPMIFQVVAFEEVVPPIVPGAWSLKAMNCAWVTPAASNSNKAAVTQATVFWWNSLTVGIPTESYERQLMRGIVFVLIGRISNPAIAVEAPRRQKLQWGVGDFYVSI